MTAIRLPKSWIALLLVHFVLTAALALLNPHVHLLDDAYYTLTIARNIAAGDGITYGGVPTNGFQPLFALVMAPLMALFGDRPETALRLAKLFLALCSTGLLLVLLHIARRLADNAAAVATGVLYVANANLLAHNLSGLETALHGLLFWLFVLAYLRYRDSERLGPLLGMGLLLGVTAYARFDTVFLFLGVGLDQAWAQRRDIPQLVRRGMALFGPAVVLLAPWFIWSRVACGSFFQSSGSFHRWRGLLQQDVPESLGGMVKFGVAKLVSLGIKLPLEPLWGYEGPMRALARRLLGQERVRAGFLVELLRENPGAAAALAGLALGGAALLVWFGRRHARRLTTLRPLAFLLPALAGAALFYPLFLLNYSMRHFFPFSAGLALVWGVWLGGFAADGPLRRRGAGLAAAIVLAALLALPGVGAWTTDHRPRTAWEVVETIEGLVPTGEKIGYTDCGVFGYYLRRHTVVNLDGILDFDALHAMRDGDIGALLVRRRIGYVLHLHNFRADYATQWQTHVAPRVTVVPPTDWLYRVTLP